MISKEKKAEIIANYGRKAGDTGSPEESPVSLPRKRVRDDRSE